MTESSIDDKLKLLGISKHEKKMRVLSALLVIQSHKGDCATFDEIRQQLVEDEGGNKVADSLIYRCLSELEEGCFIEVDRTGYRHTYSSGFEHIHKGIRNAAQKSLSFFENELVHISSEIDTLRELDIVDLSAKTVKSLVGRSYKPRLETALGMKGLSHVLDKKIIAKLQEGDVIRISLAGLEEHISIFSVVDSFTKSTKRTRIKILHNENISDKEYQFSSIINTGKHELDFRIFNQSNAEQHFISLNSDGIISIPSDTPLVSLWIPRVTNPHLIDQIIDKFELDYAKGSIVKG